MFLRLFGGPGDQAPRKSQHALHVLAYNSPAEQYSDGHPGLYMTNTSAKRQPTLIKQTDLRLTAVSMPNASWECHSVQRAGAQYAPPCTDVKATCSYRPADDRLGQKRPLAKPKPPSKRAFPQLRLEEACRKWNRYHCTES